MNKNLEAFLSTIAFSEGTIGIGNSGYNCLVGSTLKQPLLFGSYKDHPRAVLRVRRDNPLTAEDEEILSSAAGRYQILSRIYDHYKGPLRLSDFSPLSQDAIAICLINECKAYEDIISGEFDNALFKCRSRWASLPGAGYGQHEQKAQVLREAYISYGGKFSA